MNVEVNGRTYYTTQTFYNPDWWDKWLRKNLKKKSRLISKTIKKPLGSRVYQILSRQN